MNFTFNQLRIFVAVVDKKSITKASEELHMTQPAVSIQISNLQSQFDIPLIEVIARKVYVTEFGMELYKLAVTTLEHVNSIHYKTHSFRGLLSGKLRVSVVSTGKYIMPYYLKDFLKENPKIDLVMDVTNKSKVIESLEKNEVDFCLVSVLPKHIDLEEEILLPNKLVLTASSETDIKTKSRLHKSVLSDLPLIFREEGSGTRETMQQYFEKAGITPKVKLELTSSEAVKQAVLAGLGYSILPVLSLKNELKLKSIKIIPVQGLPLKSDWRLIWLRQKKFSSVAQAYLDFIRKQKPDIYKNYFLWTEAY